MSSGVRTSISPTRTTWSPVWKPCGGRGAVRLHLNQFDLPHRAVPGFVGHQTVPGRGDSPSAEHLGRHPFHLVDRQSEPNPLAPARTATLMPINSPSMFTNAPPNCPG